MSRPHLSNLEEMWSEVEIIVSSHGEQGETSELWWCLISEQISEPIF